MLTAAHLKGARVKVACINYWSHPSAPRAMSYMLIGGDAEHIIYHATWDEAMERANALARRLRSDDKVWSIMKASE